MFAPPEVSVILCANMLLVDYVHVVSMKLVAAAAFAAASVLVGGKPVLSLSVYPPSVQEEVHIVVVVARIRTVQDAQ